MKALLTSLCILASHILFAQLYINGELTIQNGATLYVDDTITINAQANVQVDGLLHNTKIIYTNFNYIKTGQTGFVITTIPTGSLKEIGLGTNSNNRVGITHNSNSGVSFKLAVRDSVFLNAQNSTGVITNNAVNKTWYIQPLDTVLNATFNAGWGAADELTGFSRNNCAIFHWLNGANTIWDSSVIYNAATFTGGSPEFMRSNTASNLTSGIHYYSIGSIGTALPVRFVNVTAKYLSVTSNKINWQISNQKNGSYFEVQRSENGVDFTTINKLKIEANANSYTFIDENTNGKTKYYQVKQVDLDNKFTLSKVVSVDVKNQAINIAIYPNPAVKSFAISTDKIVEQITIYNNLGMVASTINNYVNSDLIDISNLQSGVYFVSVKLIDQTVISKLIVE